MDDRLAPLPRGVLLASSAFKCSAAVMFASLIARLLLTTSALEPLSALTPRSEWDALDEKEDDSLFEVGCISNDGRGGSEWCIGKVLDESATATGT
ncbi:uncharacterized protein EI90DRAFT_391143 [Cantharellus anzutake]|uniref:uncharacterized protein n=1 Tax=Cantharellus anzutake TaxID=1750568 RepID=UPI001907BB40|nr:uncharacterized protein EI90DRAFT_391143 [Cantharellus anzutake]KAF8335022.1 hypothetical protein EI90DRAFT_391143 [Cantharellus anzutake]